MCDEIGFVFQLGGEFLNLEGPVESGAYFLGIDQKANFDGLAGEESSDRG